MTGDRAARDGGAGPRLQVRTLREAPDARADIERISEPAWPEFVRHGSVTSWMQVFSPELAEHQLLFYDGDTLAGVCHTAPGTWSGAIDELPQSIEALVVGALELHAAARAPDVLFALAAIVAPTHKGRGLSHRMLAEMVAHAGTIDGRALLCPVRPTWKSRYPLASMSSYVRWTRPDGAPLDPWLRVHVARGGEILAVAPCTLHVTATVAEWSEWAGMAFPESGEYVVPGALQPVVVDVERDVVRYEDPNVWIRHAVPPEERH